METAHLATCPACEGEMDVTDVGPYTRVRCPNCESEVRVKTEVGDYRLVRRVAFGGMSVVYVAWDPTLSREIAVKVLSEEYSQDQKREAQFQREAELTAAVSHPNVVRVFKVGRAFERFYIAMELVSGQSLEERMAVHGALPEDQVIPLAFQVVDGLQAAEAAGLIHRDIKPGNILIDEQESAKIVDFGLSLLTEGGAVRAEEIWATPYYVPPEALEHAQEDFRSDIYALGATLYHALSGCSPVGEKEMPTKVLREAKKSIRPLKEVAPWLSTEMIRTVEKAMAYQLEERFESYEHFREALKDVHARLSAKGAHYPVHGAVRAERRRRQESHRKAWTIAVAAFGLAAIVITTVILRQLDEPEVVAPPAPIGVTSLVPGSDAPGLDPEVALEISAAYESAREALAEDDFVVAEEHFLRVGRNPAAPAQTAAWAGFEAAVAAYLDGRPGDSRVHLAALDALLVDKGEADSALGRRLRPAGELLRSLPFVPEDRVPQRLEDPFRATIFFAMALKSWEQARFERAARMFARLAGSGPWPEAEWMTTYRKLAERYVEDRRRMQRVDHEVPGKNLAEIEQALEDVIEVYASLETRGRARFNVKVWQVNLVQRQRELRNRRVAPQWREIRESAYALSREGRFAEVADRIKSVAVEGELESKQRAGIIYLADAAAAFLLDLQRVLAPGADGVEILTRSGGRHARVVGTQDDGLLVEEGGAAQLVSWREVQPASLLRMHRGVLDHGDNRFERERRLLQAAAFAWLNGMHPEADGLARELATLKPSFGAVWNELRDYLKEE